MIDSHHHLWRYRPDEFPWIDDGMASIARDFGREELVAECRDAGVETVVSVQARQSLEETRFLLAEAENEPLIGAVVGWLPLRDRERLALAFDEFAACPSLAGVRHVVQDEPPGFMLDDAFNDGVAAVTARGLSYDVLIFPPQLAEAAEFVGRYETGRFVLDHAAKPRIARNRFDEEWRRGIAEFSRRPNAVVKWSGLSTEVRDEDWDLESLRPYWEVVLEAFGPGRIMLGSDWPVSLLRTSYGRWFESCDRLLEELSAGERSQVLTTTASEFYRLPASGHPHVPSETAGITSS